MTHAVPLTDCLESNMKKLPRKNPMQLSPHSLKQTLWCTLAWGQNIIILTAITRDKCFDGVPFINEMSFKLCMVLQQGFMYYRATKQTHGKYQLPKSEQIRPPSSNKIPGTPLFMLIYHILLITNEATFMPKCIAHTKLRSHQ